MRILVPTVTATFEFAGSRVSWVRGRTTIEEGHPIIKGREHMLEPLRLDYPAPAPRLQPQPRREKPAQK